MPSPRVRDHWFFDPSKPAHVPPVFLAPTPLGQAGTSPTFEQLRLWVANTQTEDTAREIYDGLVCDSGRAQCEMFLAMLKLSKATVVDAAAVKTPVLVIGGECDRIVPAEVLRQTAAQYQHADIVQMPGSDHMVFSGASLPITMGHIDDWLIKNQLISAATN
jgi:pimeloyl-ACP methyl ester carboxylesterase